MADKFPDDQRKNDTETQRRKQLEPEEVKSADHFQNIWDYRVRIEQ